MTVFLGGWCNCSSWVYFKKTIQIVADSTCIYVIKLVVFCLNANGEQGES